MPFDKIIDKIVALGIPGLVLLIVIETMGVAGGAAIVTALAFLGGPFGMLGGITALGLILLISQALAKYGIEKIVMGVVAGLKEKGLRIDQIIDTVNKYPISKSLKLKIAGMLGEEVE
jgi:hypothetical protein